MNDCTFHDGVQPKKKKDGKNYYRGLQRGKLRSNGRMMSSECKKKIMRKEDLKQTNFLIYYVILSNMYLNSISSTVLGNEKERLKKNRKEKKEGKKNPRLSRDKIDPPFHSCSIIFKEYQRELEIDISR
jgi:hypothetical protein